ncbi:MAG: hypothetical protein C7B47_15335 [Sulfobacillus thermosulfidooxidans]|uniref:Uncharacterized protein n=1 Tax=Sulfobacillus thermosulfidooxidans TaxID=28034 RepID=A0A2T2WPS3_SULTH|nr:MAG: hypothetical protein C7B47_15335 [Sulfobacillus thermosulfidooxidans]
MKETISKKHLTRDNDQHAQSAQDLGSFRSRVDVTIIQQILNHSRPGAMLTYIGIRGEDWDAVVLELA